MPNITAIMELVIQGIAGLSVLTDAVNRARAEGRDITDAELAELRAARKAAADAEIQALLGQG